MSIPYLLSLIVLVPTLLGTIPLLFVPKENETLIKRWAMLVSLVPLALSALLWIGYQADGKIQYGEVADWIPTLNIFYRLGVDGISVPLIFLTTLLTVISLWYSSHVIHERVKEYFALFLLLETGMLGVFCALDFFLFYIFWEIGLVPMYFLIGIWGHEEDRPQYSALKFFIYTLIGSVLMLLAILALYFATGTFDITALPEAFRKANVADWQRSLMFWGIFAAFAIKVPMWPFHTWLPDAHTAAPTAGSVILAGVLLKLGGYGFIRVLLPIFPDVLMNYAGIIVAVLAVISIVYGAFVSMAQVDLKRLIAYSSVNHMGYTMLGIAAASLAVGVKGLEDARAVALNGAVLQMFNHGIITGALFLLVGMLYERAHTRRVDAFGGLATPVPRYYGLVMLTSFASLGLPGLAGFVSEFMIFRGAFAIIPGIAAVGVLGIVITAAFILWKIIQMVFLGPLNEKWANMKD
ncbi:MAG: NADH-quinone oxidoreductase subunit M, partial [Chloroflexi bacterium]|nr:NADH-quinone oxidoreductase subunit M [Chloroflexota bacterium]